MKRYAYMIGMALFLSLLLTKPILAEEQSDLKLTEDAKASILLERDTGNILFKKNAHEKLPPASMTKVMTLLLDRKSTRLNSSHVAISYAVFCLKKKKK